MAASVDYHLPECFPVPETASSNPHVREQDLQSTISLVFLPSSGSEGFSDACPSLTDSNSTSSEGLAEQENADTPPQSPAVSPVDVFVGAADLNSASQSFVFKDEMDAVTPKSRTTERKGYFPRIDKNNEAGYKAEGEAKDAKKAKAITGTRGLEGPKISVELSALANLVLHQPRPRYGKGGSFSSTILQTVEENPTEAASGGSDTVNSPFPRPRRPMRIELPARDGFVPKVRQKKQHVGLGLGLPVAWDGKHTYKHSSPDKPVPTAVPLSPCSLASTYGLDSRENKPALRPVSEFLSTPSPMDALPSLVLSTKDNEAEGRPKRADSGAPIEQAGFTSMGLGLSLDNRVDSDSALSSLPTSESTGFIAAPEVRPDASGGSATVSGKRDSEDTFNPYFAAVCI
ncbi:hypothetical protein DFH11DRAFT_1626993 [Phellopilus nigrolimitatus]|nr:hypothetical protein DFH11DRAFT_1626993 [Phellopilus nigrolimitatus]